LLTLLRRVRLSFRSTHAGVAESSGRKPRTWTNVLGKSSSVAVRTEVTDQSARLPLRASSIGAGARGTALRPPGNWKVARPSSPTPFGQVAAALLQAAVVLEPAASAKAPVSARPSHRGCPGTSGAWLGRRRRQQWTISDSAMLRAAMRSGAVASRQKDQRRRQQTRARRLLLPDNRDRHATGGSVTPFRCEALVRDRRRR
jgi:hypothetical protein